MLPKGEVSGDVYQLPLVVDGELGLEPLSQVTATSAASSFALLRFFPSYQNLALWTDPCTVTLLDHAVRPPEGIISSVARDTWPASGGDTYLVCPTRSGRPEQVSETRGTSLRFDSWMSVKSAWNMRGIAYHGVCPARRRSYRRYVLRMACFRAISIRIQRL